MKPGTGILEHTLAYRLWQAPFAEQKLAPLRRRGELRDVRRVLDVGCGPGTNAAHFAHVDYVGIDFNPRYIASARRRYGDRFVLADVTTYRAAEGDRFDCILVNSFLHHVGDDDTRRILAHLATLLTDDGHVHVLDLVLPERPSVARVLARWDRGDYPRPLERWREIFAEAFEPVAFEPYPLGALGVTMWNMVYFKGRARP